MAFRTRYIPVDQLGEYALLDRQQARRAKQRQLRERHRAAFRAWCRARWPADLPELGPMFEAARAANTGSAQPFSRRGPGWMREAWRRAGITITGSADQIPASLSTDLATILIRCIEAMPKNPAYSMRIGEFRFRLQAAYRKERGLKIGFDASNRAVIALLRSLGFEVVRYGSSMMVRGFSDDGSTR